ncbi:holo-ACP synthase [bacterium]|nr:holo-ACP synthase [bacterium]
MAILGVGIDIIETARVQKVIDRYGSHFLTRVYTDDEINYCKNRKRSYEHFAARFAAKEAFVKALGIGLSDGIKWKDISIINNGYGKPEINFTGVARENADKKGVRKAHISITHSRYSAGAVVILEG